MNILSLFLAIDWPNVGIKATQLLLSLSIIVILHEFGHYITAKIFKCRVEKFFLFFDPWFALVKKKVGETVYGIGWLPLGGYVKISGMVDESMDKEAMSQPAQPWEFRSKPAWQRLIIMLAGVTMNVLLAFVIYAMILFTWGQEKIPMSGLKNGVVVTDSLMYQLGFRNGDQILRVNTEPVEYFDDLPKSILLNGGGRVELIRDSVHRTIDLPVAVIGKLAERKKQSQYLFAPAVPIIVRSVPDTSISAHVGFKPFDQILTLDGSRVTFYDEFRKALEAHKSQPVTLTVKRGGAIDTLHANVNEKGLLGVVLVADPKEMDSLGLVHFERTSYTFLASFPAGVKMARENLSSYVDQFKKILSPKTEAYKSVGGFKAMGSIFPSMWDWQSFWRITAFFSIALAFMNILPIPALDGGHVMFTLLEMITGRKPSQKLLEYAQVIGMVLLLGLMIYVNGNDFFGWGRGK